MTRAAARSDPGKVRDGNEDRWTIRRRGGVTLLAVADGVGGAAGGEIASAVAVDALAERFYSTLGNGVRTSLTAAVRDANDAVVRATDEKARGAATTLVAAAVRGREATVANLGDSRAYLVRGATARQLTTDHAGARTHEITRYLGDARGVQPDVFVETLRSGDRLVLCSDGLTRHVLEPEIARLARRDPASAADALVALANERGGEDNVTVVVYRAGGAWVRAILVSLVVVLAAMATGTVLSATIPPPLP
ncbi:MAG TPA: protein phosphatase 2C domain-containing protein [Candidatus Limnocylindria bacterium]|nr:protein phosphatase 2C domain-containing protein [Candidatus Limnocylindria bacterium]